MSDEALHRLLIECGFRNMLWPPSHQKWGVVGELDAGAGLPVRLVVSCVAEGERFYLLVPSAAVRDWLVEMLERHGHRDLPVRIGTLHAPDLVGAAPWLAVAAGALALFSWVLISIVR